MKRRVVSLAILVVSVFSIAAFGDSTIPILIEGEIGDYAPGSRIYEIDRNVYRFPRNIVIQSSNGRPMSFDRLTGGTRVKVLGEKTVRADGSTHTVFTKIIVMGSR